jgi:hypothetical protein
LNFSYSSFAGWWIVMMIVLPVDFVTSLSSVISAVVSSAARPEVGSSRNRMHRVGHELERDVHALPLPPESTFFSGLPISRFFRLSRPSVRQRLLDAPVDLLLGVVRREPEPRRVLHRLEHRELGVHDVVLRHVADAPPERVVDLVEILAVDPDDAPSTAACSRSAS